jgi:hypothetical protein
LAGWKVIFLDQPQIGRRNLIPDARSSDFQYLPHLVHALVYRPTFSSRGAFTPRSFQLGQTILA